MSGIIKAYPTEEEGPTTHQEITGTTRGKKHYLDVNNSRAPGTKLTRTFVFFVMSIDILYLQCDNKNLMGFGLRDPPA